MLYDDDYDKTRCVFVFYRQDKRKHKNKRTQRTAQHTDRLTNKSAPPATQTHIQRTHSHAQPHKKKDQNEKTENEHPTSHNIKALNINICAYM